MRSSAPGACSELAGIQPNPVSPAKSVDKLLSPLYND
jgi:hypothetical protein